MTELADIIRKEIRAEGAISFARFMELALYHPNLGYYERHTKQTGRHGDFFTSVSVGTLYGELLGFEFARRLDSLSSKNLCLIEAGAHDGQLARDLLSYLRQYQPSIFRRMNYFIIEPSPSRAAAQFENLLEYHGKVHWVQAWKEIEEFNGICFSNELFDAMPVHVFRWSASEQNWTEWGISSGEKDFSWSPLPPQKQNPNARKLLARLTPELLNILPDHFTVEISPEAVSWWLQAALALNEGWLFTVDYGLLEDDFFVPQRSSGTLRAYSKHHQSTGYCSRWESRTSPLM